LGEEALNFGGGVIVARGCVRGSPRFGAKGGFGGAKAAVNKGRKRSVCFRWASVRVMYAALVEIGSLQDTCRS